MRHRACRIERNATVSRRVNRAHTGSLSFRTSAISFRRPWSWCERRNYTKNTSPQRFYEEEGVLLAWCHSLLIQGTIFRSLIQQSKGMKTDMPNIKLGLQRSIFLSNLSSSTSQPVIAIRQSTSMLGRPSMGGRGDMITLFGDSGMCITRWWGSES